MNSVIEEKKLSASASDHRGLSRLRRQVLLALWGIVLAAVVVIFCGRMEESYLKNRTFFADPVGYLEESILLHELVVGEGRWAALGSELRKGWSPLRTVPLVLFAPKLLAQENGHLFTAAPALAIFLVLLGWMVDRGCGSLIFAAAAMLFCCAVRGFYDPHWGIGAYWLELPGGFLIGGAACCLGLSEGAKKTSWLVAFGILGSAAVWARQVTGVYLFVACAPLLGAALLGVVLHSTAPWRDVFRILVAVGLPVCLLVGLFLLPRIDTLYSYYAVSGYGYESVSKSFMFIGQNLLHFVSGPYLFVCVAVLATGCLFRLVASGWFYRRLPAWKILGPLAGSLWLATATFLFLGLSRQIGDARHAVFPGIILMLVGCFWPWRSRPPGEDAWRLVCKDPMFGRTACHFLLAFGMLLFFLSASFAFDAAKKGLASALNQTPRELQEKALFDELADKMKLFPRDYIWGVYFDEVLPCLRVNGFFRNRAVPLIDDTFYFVVHESYWKASYPGLDTAKIAALGVERMGSNVDVALVFSEPHFASVQWPVAYGYFFNPYSQAVAEQLALSVLDQTRWRKLFDIPTPLYGGVSGYLNLSRRGDAASGSEKQ
jgi:hypothetical protein